MWNVYMRRMHICMKCICAFHAYVHSMHMYMESIVNICGLVKKAYQELSV